MSFDRLGENAGKVQEGKTINDSGTFSKQQLIEDSRQLLSYLENIHPDPYRHSGGKVAFHGRFQDILQSIPAQGMDLDDFFQLMCTVAPRELPY